MDLLRRGIAALTARAICGFAKLLTGARSLWKGCAPSPVQRIYFSNHSSHGDFVLIWAALPMALRRRTRPVAGADYWDKNALRRWLIHEVLRGVLVDRAHKAPGTDPIARMVAAIDEGSSLILFPEGTRNVTDELVLPFRSGIFHVASARPTVECVPVWIENLNRVMPKGEFVPIPLLCTLTFGVPLHVLAGEDAGVFLARAREALIGLCPQRA